MLEQLPEKGIQIFTCEEDGTHFFIFSEEYGNDYSVLNQGDTCTTAISNEIKFTTNKFIADSIAVSMIGEKPCYNSNITHCFDGLEWGEGDDPNATFFVYAASSVAEPLSRALFQIVFPGVDNRSGLYAKVHKGLGDQDYDLLEFRQQDVVPVDLAANPQLLEDALAITVEDGALTQQEVDTIVDAISTYAGQEINLVDFIPASWQDKIITKEQAIAQGYFK